MNQPDTVVIGAGLSGLCSAILLAEAGHRVQVLEQHYAPGGYLQQFQRKKTVFDVGFHYMGSTDPGRPMRQMLEYLQVWERISCLPYPPDAAIEVRSQGRSFAFPPRFADFLVKAQATWPAEASALQDFAELCETTCARFKWFGLKRGRAYENPLEMQLSGESFASYAARQFSDPWLREVLGFQSFNLGLFDHEIPLTKFLLAFRSNFDQTCRIRGGGGSLVQALITRGEELGVQYRFRARVTGIEAAARRVTRVHTEAQSYDTELCIAACHPKPILRLISDEAIRPMFKERIYAMRESRGALQLFIRLKRPLSSMTGTCLMLRDPRQEAADPPLSVVLCCNPCALEDCSPGELRLEAMTYMDEAPFAAWRDRPVLKRGAEYETFKAQLAERMLQMIDPAIPELRDCIDQCYTGTPLSDQWYTLNERGSVFGISHDISQQGAQRPMPRVRLKNLWFVGHSINMPGICGSMIHAFDTCANIRGGDELFAALAT